MYSLADGRLQKTSPRTTSNENRETASDPWLKYQKQ